MNCYLSLGANLGDKRKQLRQAIELISLLDGVDLLSVSHFYETAPWGIENQPNFINAAVKIKTDLKPIKLLNAIQGIERKLGRIRNEHWGARTIDIDILIIDDMIIDSKRLQVPHLFMFERDFVMVPLSDIFDVQPELHGDMVIKTDGCLVDFNLKMIACVDKNFGLGFDGDLLFHNDEDMKHFRELTLNNTVIMGRKTFESISKPLENRRNIVLSRSMENVEGIEIAHDLEELYNLLSINENNFVIGGGEIYSQLMPYASEMYLTAINQTKTADTFLINFEECGRFVCISSELHNGFEFRHYSLIASERKK